MSRGIALPPTGWGDTVLTLEDLLRPGLRAVVVGINPASVSVARGHYYQGRLGQRFLSRLRQAGFMEEAYAGHEDDAAFAAGVGFTDVIKRPTISAGELLPHEYAHGRDLLANNVERYRPELLIFTFKSAAEAILGSFEGNGFISGRRMGTADVFVMPGPMESNVTAQPTLAALAERVRARG